VKYFFADNLRIAMIVASGVSYFHKDHLVSSNVITDDTGVKVETTEYMPFGSIREHTGAETSNYKFTDQELDPESGFYNYDARSYDPVIGRFVGPDPTVLWLFNPQNMNRYSYCLNNPLIYTDPTGPEQEGDWIDDMDPLGSFDDDDDMETDMGGGWGGNESDTSDGYDVIRYENGKKNTYRAFDSSCGHRVLYKKTGKIYPARPVTDQNTIVATSKLPCNLNEDVIIDEGLRLPEDDKKLKEKGY